MYLGHGAFSPIPPPVGLTSGRPRYVGCHHEHVWAHLIFYILKYRVTLSYTGKLGTPITAEIVINYRIGPLCRAVEVLTPNV